jgi:hypothetical protein
MGNILDILKSFINNLNMNKLLNIATIILIKVNETSQTVMF